MKRFTSLTAAVFTAAFLAAATSVSAQDSNVDQRTYLTFSGPVQMPGITLPAGKYVFKLAPTALHNVMQVFDGEEKHIVGQWFFVPVERTNEEQSKADGKPVVMFREMPEGMTPAVHYFFYPTDLRGKEFIYPKDQALKIAAATHETVLATDSDAAKGGEAHVFRVEPSGTESQYDQNAKASNTVSNPEPFSQEPSKADGKPVVMFREMPEGITPAVHYFFYPTDLRGKEFIYPKAQALKIAAATHETVLATDTDVEKGGEAHVFRVEPSGTESQYDQNAKASNTVSNPEPFSQEPSKAESSTTPSTASLNSQSDLNNSPASGPPAPARQAVGTAGQNPAPAPASRQQASNELPKTASPYGLIGLLGLLSLAGGFGLRLARSTY